MDFGAVGSTGTSNIDDSTGYGVSDGVVASDCVVGESEDLCGGVVAAVNLNCGAVGGAASSDVENEVVAEF